MRIMTRAEGDCNVVKSKHGSIQADFKAWKVKLLNRLQKLAKGDKKSCSGNCKTGGSCKNNTKNGHEQEEDERATQLNNSSEVTLLTLKTKKGFIQFRYDLGFCCSFAFFFLIISILIDLVHFKFVRALTNVYYKC